MNPLMTVEEASVYTRLAKSTLNKMRCYGGGPAFVRLGKRRVAYFKSALDAWLAKNTHQSTAEYISAEGAAAAL